jgi:hypothetical protein
MPTVGEAENRLLEVLTALNCWTMIQSCGRKALPETIYYPACFVMWDGDDDTGSKPRPVDATDFKVIIQCQNLAGEDQAAVDVYSLNDLVRAEIRGKTLGIPDIDTFTCVSRRCTDYDDADGMIEYTHIYRTRFYNQIPVE